MSLPHTYCFFTLYYLANLIIDLGNVIPLSTPTHHPHLLHLPPPPSGITQQPVEFIILPFLKLSFRPANCHLVCLPHLDILCPLPSSHLLIITIQPLSLSPMKVFPQPRAGGSSLTLVRQNCITSPWNIFGLCIDILNRKTHVQCRKSDNEI